MKQHAYRARLKQIRSKERAEFNVLEAYVNDGKWDPGPFGVYAKQIDPSVGVDDWNPPPIENARARARELSYKFWPIK